MHVLVYVDSHDVNRIPLLRKYVKDESLTSIELDEFQLNLINVDQQSDVHLFLQGNKLSDPQCSLQVELSPSDVCVIGLSHIGILHSDKEKEFLQRFHFNGQHYNIPDDHDLQIHLLSPWQVIYKKPHIAISRVGSETIKRLILCAEGDHSLLRKIKREILDG